MITLVKYINNYKEDSPNRIITKTLGKLGVLDKEKVEEHGRMPSPEEFWFSEIVKETGAGTSRGMFILNPIKKVKEIPKDGRMRPDIIRLIPGAYATEQVGNALLLHPKKLWYPEKLGPNWILGVTVKRSLKQKFFKDGKHEVNSIIIAMDGTHEWPTEEWADLS